MSENLANQDAKVAFENTAGPPDLVYGGDADITALTTTWATKVKASSKPVASTSVTAAWLVAVPCPYSSPTYAFVGGGGVILAQGTKCKASGQLIMRETDESVVGCVGSWTEPPYNPVPCACRMYISDGGQDKAKGI